MPSEVCDLDPQALGFSSHAIEVWMAWLHAPHESFSQLKRGLRSAHALDVSLIQVTLAQLSANAFAISLSLVEAIVSNDTPSTQWHAWHRKLTPLIVGPRSEMSSTMLKSTLPTAALHLGQFPIIEKTSKRILDASAMENAIFVGAAGSESPAFQETI